MSTWQLRTASMQAILKLFTLSVLSSQAAANSQHCTVKESLTAVNGSLCVTSEFTETPIGSGPASEFQCSLLCASRPRCQAFSTADGPCKLFVFDRCSKQVRNCSCSATGRLFVKRQSGLQPGRLCPSGYDDQLCGVRYKLYSNSSNWHQSRHICDTDSGLVIMADVMDAAEMSFINSQYSSVYSSGGSVWLGGYQNAGSAEPSGGWQWVSCGLDVSAALWGDDEPNNSGDNENAICRYQTVAGLADIHESSSIKFGLCECVSPFD